MRQQMVEKLGIYQSYRHQMFKPKKYGKYYISYMEVS